MEKMQVTGIGKYNIPEIFPVTDIEPDIEFITFNSLKTLKNRKRYGVNFFIDDYQFDRIWQRPDVYCEMLKECKLVLSPDFTMYADAPLSMQIWKHYQKQWYGRYMQKNGIKVVPALGWSDDRSFEFCFDGIPCNSVVAVSSVGVLNNKNSKNLFLNGFKKSIDLLTPCKILFFGQLPKEIDTSGIQIIHYPHSFDDKFRRIRNGG
jgi:hypothetical protein